MPGGGKKQVDLLQGNCYGLPKYRRGGFDGCQGQNGFVPVSGFGLASVAGEGGSREYICSETHNRLFEGVGV